MMSCVGFRVHTELVSGERKPPPPTYMRGPEDNVGCQKTEKRSLQQRRAMGAVSCMLGKQDLRSPSVRCQTEDCAAAPRTSESESALYSWWRFLALSARTVLLTSFGGMAARNCILQKRIRHRLSEYYQLDAPLTVNGWVTLQLLFRISLQVARRDQSVGLEQAAGPHSGAETAMRKKLA